MIVINRLMDELTDISVEYNKGEISKKELNTKLSLLIGQIERVSINMDEVPLDRLEQRSKESFNQLLYQARFKSIEAIKELMEATSKQSYNAKLRHILGNRLYFKGLFRTVKVNCTGYISRNHLKFYSPNMQVFILEGGNEKCLKLTMKE